MDKKILAIDIGASSGRAILGTYNKELLEIQEIHRFQNDPVSFHGTLYWDFLRLLHEIKISITKAKVFGTIDSIGVDTWGVDFGLLDKKGNLIENPIHYRDLRTKGMIEESSKYINPHDFYQMTGNQFMEINTVFQLLSLQKIRPDILNQADSLLLIPDLINFFLTGIKKSEYSIVSTTQLMDPYAKNWNKKILELFSLPTELFQEVIPTGTMLSTLSADLCQELNVSPSKVIAVAGHDTQCALACTPSEEDDFIFLSCGTWSLMGTELEKPLIHKKTEQYNMTNEGGYDNRISFHKNMVGLWLIQECRRQWIREGKDYDFSYLEEIAKTVKPFHCFIDPDDEDYGTPGNLPQLMKDFCKHSKQNTPYTEAEIVRMIYESLALKYRLALEEIQECTGKIYHTIYMLGGGIQSKLLCQMTADATNCKVVAGPVEATTYGNLLIQLLATKELKDLKEARNLIRKSCPLEVYLPTQTREWKDAFLRFQNII